MSHAIVARMVGQSVGSMPWFIGTPSCDLTLERAASGRGRRLYNVAVGIFAIVLIAAALLLVLGAEWPRLTEKLGHDARASRTKGRRKRNLRVVDDGTEESDDFAASVQRDLENLPVLEERDGKSRR